MAGETGARSRMQPSSSEGGALPRLVRCDSQRQDGRGAGLRFDRGSACHCVRLDQRLFGGRVAAKRPIVLTRRCRGRGKTSKLRDRGDISSFSAALSDHAAASPRRSEELGLCV